jgi:curved DNA-binding protein CbpA
MTNHSTVDYYEVLQVNSTAEPETIHRVYRLLAQRFHPDNKETGDDRRFRLLTEAYQVLSNPEERARYDLQYNQAREERWRLASKGTTLESDAESEELVRTTVLEVLYARRRYEPNGPGIFVLDLEKLTGTPREHLDFTVWYLLQKKLVQRADNSTLVITADGVDFLEQHHRTRPKRLAAQNDPSN